MKLKQTILNQLPKHLFWDLDPSNLDIRNDMNLIIPRALFATNSSNFEADISRLESVYTENEIVDTLKHTKERISDNLCSLVAKHYNIKPFSRYAR